MIQRKDLADIGDENYGDRIGEYLVCQHCSTFFGGTRGDYWGMEMSDPIRCPECEGIDLALVRDKTERIVIKQ